MVRTSWQRRDRFLSLYLIQMLPSTGCGGFLLFGGPSRDARQQLRDVQAGRGAEAGTQPGCPRQRRFSGPPLLVSSLLCIYGSVTCLFDCSLSGSSDPYVKFKLAGKEVFRSKIIHKNLNPVWDQKTTLVIDSLSEPLYVKVRTTTGVFHCCCWTQGQWVCVCVCVLFFCRCLTMTLASKMILWVLRTSTWSLWSSRGMSV